MYNVNVKEGERFYYLRMLLLHQKNCQSFADIRTVHGTVYRTYREAAVAMELLEDDEIWDRTLSEAEHYQMPRCLRQLFVTILVFCSPSEPGRLWTKHALYLSEDFTDKGKVDQKVAEQKALAEINIMLAQHGKRCTDYELPDVPGTTGFINTEERYDPVTEQTLAESLISSLNDEQQVIFDTIMKEVDCYKNNRRNRDGTNHRMFFVDSPGGTGKTYIYRALMHAIRAQNDTA